MLKPPQRPSLVEQVAQVLRQNLRAPEWAAGLPAERTLCDRLQVSRPTVRAALDLLRREGLIRSSASGRIRFAVRQRRGHVESDSHLVGFLTPESILGLFPSSVFLIEELRRHLQDAQLALEVRTDSRLQQRDPRRVLEALTQQTQAGCWVLHRCSRDVQEWFARSHFRVIVQGTCHPGIRFPSIDVHHRAVARHAAGLLLSKGHRRIAFLSHRSGLAGDLAGERGFRETCAGGNQRGVVPLLVPHDGELEQIRQAIRALWQSRTPPTALMVSHASHLLTAMSELMNSGLRVPADVSLLCCEHQGFLEYLTPTIARYRFDWAALAGRLSRMVARLATTGVLAAQSVRLIPPFLPGESVAEANATLPATAGVS